MTTFKLGDLVKLKSGGPVMTVNRNIDQFTSCIWFHPLTQELKDATFKTEQLVLIPSEG